MSGANVFGLLLVLAALAFQVSVTRRVRRSSLFDRDQKWAQTKLIWFVPIVGAAIVFGVVASEEEAMRPKREHRG
jgi:hypothetical protein